MSHKWIAIVIWLLIWTDATAQEACYSSLIQDRISFADSWIMKYAFFKSVSKGEWDELQRKGELDAFIKGVPIKGNYDEMKKWASQFEEKTALSLDQSRATSLLVSRLSDENLSAYVKCLELNSQAPILLHASKITPNLVVVTGRWKASEIELDRFEGLSDSAVGAQRAEPMPRPASGEQFQIRYARNNPETDVSIKIVASYKTKAGGIVEKSAEVGIPPWVTITMETESSDEKKVTLVYDAVSASESSSRTCSGTARPGFHIKRASVAAHEVSRRGNWQNGWSKQAISFVPDTSTPTRFEIVVSYGHNRAHAAEQMIHECRWFEERTVIRKNGVPVGQL